MPTSLFGQAHHHGIIDKFFNFIIINFDFLAVESYPVITHTQMDISLVE